MIKDKLIILPIDGDWNHTADFLRQTAITLSKQNQVIIYDQRNAYFFLKKPKPINYPQHQNISFHQVKYFLPLRRFTLLEKFNRRLSFYLFLRKYQYMQKILWIFYPNYWDLACVKNHQMVKLYDCVDYNESKDKEELLISNVDYFFVNSMSLYQLHQAAAKKPIYINAQGCFIPDIKKVKKVAVKTTKPVIGYVGGINYRLDFHLLDQLVRRNPKWHFVFYGPQQKYPEKDRQFKTASWIKKIKSYRNVTFDQSSDKYTVYGMIKNFDVAIIPYDNKILFNKYCYPMKIFEYFYFGKPVVSSEIEELKTQKFKNTIKIAKKSTYWEKYIAYLLKHKSVSSNLETGKKLAMANSWERKIKEILKVVSLPS